MKKHLSLFAVAACLAGTAHADTQADFALIFANCKASYQALRAGGVVADVPPNWIRKITTASQLRYEISQKYYSSPFVAVMTVDLTEAFGTANSEAAAKQLVADADNRIKHDVVRLNYIHQDGRWKTTSVDIMSETRRRRDEPWGPAVTTQLTGDVLLRSSEPWVACIK